jgi:hypothetical protein
LFGARFERGEQGTERGDQVTQSLGKQEVT